MLSTRKLAMTALIVLASVLALQAARTDSQAAAQTPPVDTKKLYAEIAGDFEFVIDGQAIILNFFEKDGRLYGAPAGESVEELTPVQGSPLKFEVRPGGSDRVFSLEFMRNEQGQIDRCRVITDEFDTIGQRIKKAA